MELINFDNAATTFPKPPSVIRAAQEAAQTLGGNAGRGGHALAMRSSEAVFSARETVAELFGAAPENVVFTSNCTHALNLAIHGIMAGGGHLIISSLEHNSAARPAAALAKDGQISLSVAQVFPDDDRTVESFRRLIRSDTKAVVCTMASNVTGQILPIRRIAELCKSRGICLIADG
ncbi:MAG TPA: aminotransferase class V-fold PLP-dependent enzyme, partial [Ruminococcus sp.]|nr:aminotransferase class V-fold PLP-dependent enzyme [Ruminococcus sp.]